MWKINQYKFYFLIILTIQNTIRVPNKTLYGFRAKAFNCEPLSSFGYLFVDIICHVCAHITDKWLKYTQAAATEIPVLEHNVPQMGDYKSYTWHIFSY